MKVTIDLNFMWFGRKYNTEFVQPYKAYFPEAETHLFTDLDDVEDDFFYKVHRVDTSMFDSSHERFHYRCADYWKTRSMLESKADIALGIDGDTYVMSEKVRAIIPLAQAFGVCIPSNPRCLVAVDQEIGTDVDDEQDETQGMAYAMNCATIAACKAVPGVTELLEKFLEIKIANPRRGPLTWWRAVWATKFMPCLLPPQWCLCAGPGAHPTVKYMGIGNEVIIHAGHPQVREHYGIDCTP